MKSAALFLSKRPASTSHYGQEDGRRDKRRRIEEKEGGLHHAEHRSGASRSLKTNKPRSEKQWEAAKLRARFATINLLANQMPVVSLDRLFARTEAQVPEAMDVCDSSNQSTSKRGIPHFLKVNLTPPPFHEPDMTPDISSTAGTSYGSEPRRHTAVASKEATDHFSTEYIDDDDDDDDDTTMGADTEEQEQKEDELSTCGEDVSADDAPMDVDNDGDKVEPEDMTISASSSATANEQCIPPPKPPMCPALPSAAKDVSVLEPSMDASDDVKQGNGVTTTATSGFYGKDFPASQDADASTIEYPSMHSEPAVRPMPPANVVVQGVPPNATEMTIDDIDSILNASFDTGVGCVAGRDTDAGVTYVGSSRLDGPNEKIQVLENDCPVPIVAPDDAAYYTPVRTLIEDANFDNSVRYMSEEQYKHMQRCYFNVVEQSVDARMQSTQAIQLANDACLQASRIEQNQAAMYDMLNEQLVNVNQYAASLASQMKGKDSKPTGRTKATVSRKIDSQGKQIETLEHTLAQERERTAMLDERLKILESVLNIGNGIVPNFAATPEMRQVNIVGEIRSDGLVEQQPMTMDPANMQLAHINDETHRLTHETNMLAGDFIYGDSQFFSDKNVHSSNGSGAPMQMQTATDLSAFDLADPTYLNTLIDASTV